MHMLLIYKWTERGAFVWKGGYGLMEILCCQHVVKFFLLYDNWITDKWYGCCLASAMCCDNSCDLLGLYASLVHGWLELCLQGEPRENKLTANWTIRIAHHWKYNSIYPGTLNCCLLYSACVLVLNGVILLLGQGVDLQLIVLSFSGYISESRASLHLANVFQRCPIAGSQIWGK
jgi:hypothetical protein